MNGALRLMKNLVWEYDALPHALICGGTDDGKTYFILTINEALLRTNAVLYVLDPKNGANRFYCKFIDNQTKAIQVSQFGFVLHKDINWKI